jgi:hypothetical protein
VAKNPRVRRRIRIRRLDTSLFDALSYLTNARIRNDDRLKHISKAGDWKLFRRKLQEIVDDEKFWVDVIQLLRVAERLKFQVGY